ncbi:MAG: ABC transporter ATP-binding protein [Eubacteriales bacterium]|nr:ABC transporter ATP-binding protein [Eubacteriales bacterium]MDD3882971.1 ABC transporter ATP-binding protein [Eubacteriales bacterium]MDD4513482.1 ABC transporter ATP-binding protein [Eubacteriales bacterium]
MIEIRDIEKKYEMGGETVHALDKVTLSIQDGEFVAIIGPSGSGKSTLMNIIGCLDVADSGTYILNGKPIEKYSERQLARIRNKNIGFIFQGFNLLSKLSALENVELPMIYQGVPAHERHKRAKEALEHVGLAGRIKHKPTELSGGQQQRCAIARALAAHPSLILADEPTGNLDKKTGKEILNLFLELHEQGNTIVLITHDPKVADWAERIVYIEDGKITSEGRGTRRYGTDELTIDEKHTYDAETQAEEVMPDGADAIL